YRGEDRLRPRSHDLRDRPDGLRPLQRKLHRTRRERLRRGAAGNGGGREPPRPASVVRFARLLQCEDCQSVYSPAAYLVDLLQYLGQFSAGGAAGISTARDALLARRPDLQYIALDCANTTTTLPYIDLVNEILENVVALPR